ncbi:MAG: hypothetical protein K1X67_16315 [Fimbriimonadaceae bacterium]|nr:hypothetical protein [Fimbriimonadaceae bacterium]
MIREHAEALVGALEELTAIARAQAIDAAKARDRATQLERMFESSLDRRLNGERPELSMPEAMIGRTDELRDQWKQSRRREACLFEALEALMHLYGFPKAQATCDHVFQCLKHLRMIDVGDDPTELAVEPNFGMPSADNPTEMQRQMLRHVADFQSRMRERMEKQHAKWDEQIKRSDALVAEALASARSLLD